MNKKWKQLPVLSAALTTLLPTAGAVAPMAIFAFGAADAAHAAGTTLTIDASKPVATIPSGYMA
jgi:hypothetical protein